MLREILFTFDVSNYICFNFFSRTTNKKQKQL